MKPSKLLLDSHVLLWHFKDPGRISTEARGMILSATAVFVSAASTWEIYIKQLSGKLPPLPEDLDVAIVRAGFLELPITAAHTKGIQSLQMEHKDPFDQLLLSQAQAEDMLLLTADEKLLGKQNTFDVR
ncbi:MAG: type II toxin-antitoxin system VapC family toxin [Candidatus Saccharimonadales bacterium]